MKNLIKSISDWFKAFGKGFAEFTKNLPDPDEYGKRKYRAERDRYRKYS